jgi:transcriptional regulator with XRE-family HTH domain
MRYNAQVFFIQFLIGMPLDGLAEKISSALRTLRSRRGWSLDVTSQMTGVSKAMLGQIERGESSPTIATLWKIARGFDVSFSVFVGDDGPTQADVIHRTSHLQQIHPEDDKMRIMPLFTYDETLSFEVFIIELLPGVEHLSPPHQKQVVEHIIVTEGEIEVLVGKTWQRLKLQEGLRFNAAKPHGYRNLSSRRAVFHDMIHYKTMTGLTG